MMGGEQRRPDVARCRGETAELLTKALATTRKLEARPDVVVGWSEATAEIDLNADPNATLRIQGALLLRKARIHTLATLSANDSNNLHSLAVQMRPVLECAGQVVFTFWNAYIAPNLFMSQEKAVETLARRLNADF